MAIQVARVHLAMAHAALPALLPTPPISIWKKMLPQLLPTPPCPCVAASGILPKPPLATKPGRADADERWDARKTTKPACSESKASSSPRKNATCSPPPKPGRADSVERWDAHKKAAAIFPASSPSSSSSSAGASSTSSKLSISRLMTSAAERWDVHKKRRAMDQAEADDDDGESSSASTTGSNDMEIDTEEEDDEEEIVWKPRQGMYAAGPGLVVAGPEQPSLLPMPTAYLLVPVA